MEEKLYRHLYNYLLNNNNGDIILPNIFIEDYELDFMKLHSNGLISEYEIKRSKADFKKDFHKKKRNKLKHDLLKQGLLPTNRFYFVVPHEMINVKDVPDYAGLIYIKEHGKVELIKNAPLLHSSRYFITLPRIMKLLKKLSFREMLWRTKANKK